MMVERRHANKSGSTDASRGGQSRLKNPHFGASMAASVSASIPVTASKLEKGRKIDQPHLNTTSFWKYRMKVVLTSIVLTAVSALTTPVSAEVLTGSMTGSNGKMERGVGNFAINSGSTLVRHWTVINDESLTVKITEYTGLGLRAPQGDWAYKGEFKIEVSDNITAVEIIVLPFDIWGEVQRPLKLTKITDMEAGPYQLEGMWRIRTDDEASTYYSSMAYVSKVRLASGEVQNMNTDKIIDEAQKFSDGFQESDLSRQ